jgi:glutaredoxin
MNKNVPVDKKLYNDVKKEAKKRFKVWPSAYASGWLVKEYKKRGGKYKVEKSPKRKSKSRRRKSPKRKSKSRRRKSPKRKSKSRRRKTSKRKSKSRRRKTPKRKSKSRRRKTPKRKSKSRRRKTPKRKSKSRRCKTPKRKSKSTSRNYGLNRWFDEEWIDVCKLPKIVKCGRDKAEWKNYPYCRPRKRINKKTPKTASELTKAEIKKRCAKKKKNPSKRVLPKRKTKSILRKSSSFMNNWNKGWFIVSKEEGKCKYCEEAKKLLSTKVKSYNVEILTDTNKEEIYNRVDKITNNYRYFPMIFYNQKFIC